MAKGSQRKTEAAKRKAPARGKPGTPKGAKSAAARRTQKSKAATAGRSNNPKRKKNK